MRHPEFGVLHFIRENKPIAYADLRELWERVQDYEVLETVVDIATAGFMPLWAAKEQYWREWKAYQQNSPGAEHQG